MLMYLSRIKLWVQRVLMGVVALLFLYHLLEIARVVPVSDAKIETVVASASLLVLFLVLDELHSLGVRVEHSERQLQETQSQMARTESSLEGLAKLLRSGSDMTSYWDGHAFQSQWERLTKRFSRLYLIGTPPKGVMQEVGKLCAESRELSLYRPLASVDPEEIKTILRTGENTDCQPKLFQTDSFDALFLAVGNNPVTEETEILLHLWDPVDVGLAGLHVSGELAARIMNCIKPRLNEAVAVQGPTFYAVRIYSTEEAENVNGVKVQYQRERLRLSEGIPMVGEDVICDRMTRYLETTERTLTVTHMATAENIPLLERPVFQAWIMANYEAVKRGINIERIFIVNKENAGDAVLKRVASAMLKNGITVRQCILESLDPTFQEDFSLYDERHLIYITRTRTGWHDKAEARRTDNLVKIQLYRETFTQIHNTSSPVLPSPETTA